MRCKRRRVTPVCTGPGSNMPLRAIALSLDKLWTPVLYVEGRLRGACTAFPAPGPEVFYDGLT